MYQEAYLFQTMVWPRFKSASPSVFAAAGTVSPVSTPAALFDTMLLQIILRLFRVRARHVRRHCRQDHRVC